MHKTLGRVMATAALAAMVAGCGGGGAAASPAASPARTSGATAVPGDATPAAATTAAPPDAPAAGGPTDACAMLTIAEVKQVTGEDTTAGVESTSGMADWVAGECWWNSATMSVRFALNVGTPDSIAKADPGTAAEQLELSKLAFKAMDDYEVLNGLGDGALYAAGMVTVVKGGSMLQVSAFMLPKAKAIELAKLALPRL